MKISGGTPTKESNLSTPENSLRVTPTKPSSFGNVMVNTSGTCDVVSSLNVVCYDCLCKLSYWNWITNTGSCREPFHEKVHSSQCLCAMITACFTLMHMICVLCLYVYTVHAGLLCAV